MWHRLPADGLARCQCHSRVRVPRVSDERQQAEKCGQRILAFSRPCDRFHVQRMQRKKRRDQRARPAGVCCSQQKPEEKQRVCRMNQRVNEQMATRNPAEELAIDHMCDPCEWMPVPRVKGGKRPAESRERNTAIHHWIFLDISGVIERDEAMPDHLRIDHNRHYRQTDQDEKVGSPECCNVADLESFRSSFVGCGKADSFSLFRGPFSHALRETIR